MPRKAKKQGNPYDMPRLRTALPGWRIHYLPTAKSTNDIAAKMRKEGRLFAPAIVFTSKQTAGRGRGGNVWVSDPGTMTATFALPVDEARPPEQLPILAGLAVRDAAATLLPRDVSVDLKWPNDLLIADKKVAGLLCERADHVELVGVGLNVLTNLAKLPAEVRARATSLDECGSSASVTTALITVAHQLHALITAPPPFTAVLRRYDAHHALVGRKISVQVADGEVISGTCEGLDAQGRLVVKHDQGVDRLISGQVVKF